MEVVRRSTREKAHIQQEVAFVPFDNLLNLRDVGKTVNTFLGENRLVEGRLFRSARPDDATASDRRRLKEEYGIKTVMDLRTITEHVQQAEKREAESKIPALVQSNEALAEPLKIPGMDYLEININGKGFERSLLWRLSLWSFIKLITLMIFGYRMDAISILGREVMQPRGLVGLGFDSIDHCGPEIAEVPIKCITYDYCLSEKELAPEREGRVAEMKQIGLTEDFAACPKDWIKQMSDHLNEKYGGIEAYLMSIGFVAEHQQRLVEILSR
ncbi:4-nitrophenylphosphatase [Chlorociboria aeruginascens]|nr:4-nitrophenylphosphatase [Chlorociboria aeruginascens]